MSLRLAAKYSLTTNTHKKQNVLKVYYTYESNKGSPVSLLACEESQNLHVKIDKKHEEPGLNCTGHVLTTKSMIIHAFTLGSHDMAQKKAKLLFLIQERLLLLNL